MRPRILLNLGVFAALGTVLAIWAATTLLPFRLNERTFSVRAEFLSSPGLRDGLEVDYLGVRIGRVDTVSLSPGKVIVALKIDDDVVVPGDATAQVLRKSAVGEPYVELTPPARPSATALADGDVIPLSRTSITVAYERLFKSAGDLLRAVPPDDLRTLTHELATGLQGQGQNLRDTLADLDRFTGTLADQSGVLDALAVQLTQLTGTLADKGPALAGGVNSLAEFTGSLSSSRRELNSILDRSPDFLAGFNGLLDDAKPGLRCLLTALGTPGPTVFDSKRTRDLHHALDMLTHQFPALADSIIVRRPEGAYVNIGVVFTVAGPVPNAAEYPHPTADPVVPPIYYCRDSKTGRAPDRTATAPATAPRKQVAAPAAEVFTTVKPKPVSASSQWSPGRWLPLLPVVVAALVLTATAISAARHLTHARFSQRPRRR